MRMMMRGFLLSLLGRRRLDSVVGRGHGVEPESDKVEGDRCINANGCWTGHTH